MKKFSIIIPVPCHEDWENMTVKQKGRFCSVCAKTVVDFTKMTKNQITDYVKDNKNICGNFRIDQLNTEYGTPNLVFNPVKRVSFIVGLSLMSLQYTPAQTQETPTEQLEEKPEPRNTLSCASTTIITDLQGKMGIIETVPKENYKKGRAIIKRTYGTLIIQGIIYQDEDKKLPLANAEISIPGFSFKTHTNENGEFYLMGIKTAKNGVRIKIQKADYQVINDFFKVKRKQKTLIVNNSLLKHDNTLRGEVAILE